MTRQHGDGVAVVPPQPASHIGGCGGDDQAVPTKAPVDDPTGMPAERSEQRSLTIPQPRDAIETGCEHPGAVWTERNPYAALRCFELANQRARTGPEAYASVLV